MPAASGNIINGAFGARPQFSIHGEIQTEVTLNLGGSQLTRLHAALLSAPGNHISTAQQYTNRTILLSR